MNPDRPTRRCYLCGKIAPDTRDHIPPRAFFPRKPKGQLITVPAHSSCNNKFARDDELFRNLIVFGSSKSPAARRAWEEQVIPSWEKNRRAHRQLRKYYHKEFMRTKTGELVLASGVWVRKRLVRRQIARWARGIYYRHLGFPLNPRIKINFDWLRYDTHWLESTEKVPGVPLRWQIVEPGVLRYEFAYASYDIEMIFVAFVLFEQAVFLVTTKF